MGVPLFLLSHRYLEERKKKLKLRKRKKAELDSDSLRGNNEYLVWYPLTCLVLGTDEVKFGEVVQAPPRLSTRPRNAKKKSKLEPIETAGPVADSSKVLPRGLRHLKDIEEERETVISKYREVRKTRLKQRMPTT